MQMHHVKHVSALLREQLSKQPYCYSSAENTDCLGLREGMTSSTFYQSMFLLSSPCSLPWLHLVHIWPIRFLPLRISYAHMLLQVLQIKCRDGDDGERMCALFEVWEIVKLIKLEI